MARPAIGNRRDRRQCLLKSTIVSINGLLILEKETFQSLDPWFRKEAKEGESGDDEKGESGVRGCESGDEGDDELVIDFKTACQYSYALTKFALNNNMTALCDIFNNAKQDIEKAHLRKQANKKQIKMDRFLDL